MVLEGIFSYDAATDLMRKQLVGKVIRMAWRRVRIEDVTLRGIGSGRVALGVTFSGAVQGRIFFTGTPRLDLAKRQLTVPDLDFDVGSTDLPASGLWWWHGDAVRDFLRAKAAIPDSVALAGLERRAEHGMNRELAAGVRLEVTLNDSRGMAVCATREHLVVRALAEGQARLVVDRVLGRASYADPLTTHETIRVQAPAGSRSRGRRPRQGILARIGPGLITGASDDDPSGIATYSQVGSQFGLGMLWTMVFSYPLMGGIQEISARVGLVTGRGLGRESPKALPARSPSRGRGPAAPGQHHQHRGRHRRHGRGPAPRGRRPPHRLYRRIRPALRRAPGLTSPITAMFPI